MDPPIRLHPIIRIRLVRAGGMPRQHIALFAAGAALIGATLAVITDRVRAARQQARASTTSHSQQAPLNPDGKIHPLNAT